MGRIVTLLALVAVAMAVRGADTGSSHNLFVRAAIDDRWFLTSRDNLATRSGFGNLFFGYVDLNLGYKLTDRWSLEAGYRQAWLETARGTRVEHRPLVNLTWRRRIDPWFVSNRHRLELRTFAGRARDRFRYRNETRVLAPRRLTPAGFRLFLEEEFFYEFDGSGFNTNWLTGGASYRVSRALSLKAGYRWQAQKFGGDWQHRHVLVTGAILSF